MPRIFDNIEQRLLPALVETMARSTRADFCVGYFNLRDWKLLDPQLDRYTGPGQVCRVLLGMHASPEAQLEREHAVAPDGGGIDNATALRLRRKLAEDLRAQLTRGIPSREDEAGLRRLAERLRAGRMVVKLYLRHPLHAKLYLVHRDDPNIPIVGFLGSSNLTFSGLAGQGELNIDVLDGDACAKLARWFDDRWGDRFCVDITQELIRVIDESWAREVPLPPYLIYLKIAYHLAREARAGLADFNVPRLLRGQLWDFQAAAVRIAAHHLNRRGGVLLGDVVGLGKTLMATALLKIFDEDHGLDALILCPPKLVPMWEDYRERYGLRARVLSLGQAQSELPDLRRYRIVVIDESHNLRNREGRRYRAIADYVQKNDCKVVLLSATPYNKSYLDLSAQLRLFVAEDADLGVRPEKLLREMGPEEFTRRHQCGFRSIAAFEKSPHVEDWRDLMRLYLVRRTRSFIQRHYAALDESTGRRFLTFEDGTRSYFPMRVPRTVAFATAGSADPYVRLFDKSVVDTIGRLALPRYGLARYLDAAAASGASAEERRILLGLSRAGQRLKGFCRINLFKRLESSGAAFLQSVRRHVLRNHVLLHALAGGEPLPIGALSAELLDPDYEDEDRDEAAEELFEGGDDVAGRVDDLASQADFAARAEALYRRYRGPLAKRFRWIAGRFFQPALADDLRADAERLGVLVEEHGRWSAGQDEKLRALRALVMEAHPDAKVLVFSQFADTVRYLGRELAAAGVARLGVATGSEGDPTELAARFSPRSNGRADRIAPAEELRVLLTTDVLSEGHNLQDAGIVVNFDLPWAIIRLVQRAGRVDRIGQRATEILCYSFLPAEGVERIIQLRSRIRRRLRENAEVVGTDERFFDDPADATAAAGGGDPLVDLYHEKAGILDGDDDDEVDLASLAYQIWKDAIAADPGLEKKVAALPDVVYATRALPPGSAHAPGVLVYLRTAGDSDVLAWLDGDGRSVTESQLEILRAAECAPDTKPAEPRSDHHDLIARAVRDMLNEERRSEGALGSPRSARYRVYERLKAYSERVKGTLFDTKELNRLIDEIYRHPLLESTTDTLNRQLRAGIDDDALLRLLQVFRDEGRLCYVEDADRPREPRIVCSLGLASAGTMAQSPEAKR